MTAPALSKTPVPHAALCRLMADRIPGVVWTTDTDLRFTASFGAGLAALGLQSNEVVGKSLFEYFRTNDAETPPIAAHYRALRGAAVDYEQDWQQRTYEVHIEQLRDDTGAVIGCVGFAHDVTERKHLQTELQEAQRDLEARVRERTAEFRAIYECMGDGLLIADIETKEFLRANRAIGQMLGYAPEELTSLSVRDIHPPADLPAVLEAFHTQAAGNLLRADSLPVLRKDGSVFLADITSNRIQYRGRPCLIGFFRDVTGRRRAEELLRRQNELLRRSLLASDQDRRLIAYELHDSLAQQIAGALLYFQAFERKQGADPPAADVFRQGLKALRESHLEIRRLIQDVRPLTLDEMGAVAAITQFIRSLDAIPGPRVEFVNDVEFDRLQPLAENALYRIVQESVANARKHSGSERVRVELTQRAAQIRVQIQDWGIGFALEENLPASFGLESIRERAKMLGGRAEIDSAPGQGTRITVDLPLLLREPDE